MISRTVLAGVLLSFTAIAPSLAQAAVRHPIDIPQQQLGTALTELARQTRIQFVYSADLVEGRYADALSGTMTPEEALAQLLAKTGLHYEFLDPETITLSRAGGANLAPGANTGTTNNSTAHAPESREARNRSFWDRFRLAQADQGEAGALRAGESSPVEEYRPSVVNLPEVLVKGSKSLNMDIQRTRDDAQPYVVFDREAIAKSGARTVEDFLQNRLTMSTNAETSIQSFGSIVGATSSINLRGLGTNQTLILVDGHRIAGNVVNGNPNQPDLNGVPLAAIERIEVLPTTASGIYGGSATGGVINVVLRRDYSGVETKLTYGSAFSGGGSTRQADVSAGFNLEGGKTNILLSGSYQDANPLLARDRDFVQRGREKIMQNDPGFFLESFAPPLGTTTNISSAPAFDLATLTITRPNLTLKSGAALNSTSTWIPVGYGGTSIDGGAALVQNAGQYNLGLANTAQSTGGGGALLLGAPELKSVGVTVRREFSSHIEAFLELGGADNTSRGIANGAGGSFMIPASSPNNPFNEDIYVTTATFGADRPYESVTRARRAVGGVLAQLPWDWRGELDYSLSKSTFSASIAPNLSPAASAAVASGALDVLRDTNQFPVDFSPFVGDAFRLTPSESETRDTTLRLAGPVGSLPGGRPIVSLLAEHREEEFGEAYSINPFAPQLFPGTSQKVGSLYLETKLPLVSQLNRLPGVRFLELQIAGRRDEYTVDGARAVPVGEDLVPLQEVTRYRNTLSSTNPTFGLRYEPIADLMLRGSYGKGFLPPAVNQLFPGAPQVFSGGLATFLGLSDPRRGGEPLGDFLLATGGNPDLRPERSESWSAGFVLTPRAIPDLRLSLDWTRTKKTDNITTLNLDQSTLADELVVDGLITRGPVEEGSPFDVGPITGVNLILTNVARARFEAYDFAADYRMQTERWGSVELSLVGTRLMHVQTQTTLNSPVVENVAVAGAIINQQSTGGGLKWKANATIAWNFRDWTAGWTTRYFGSYFLNTAHTAVPIQGAAEIPSQTYHDLFVVWSVPKTIGLAVLSSTEVSLSIQNVLDRSPPIDVVGAAGFSPVGYSTWGDPRLSSYSLSIRKAF